MRTAILFIATLLMSCAKPAAYSPAPGPATFPAPPNSIPSSSASVTPFGPPPLPPVVVHPRSSSTPNFPVVHDTVLKNGPSLRVVERPNAATVLVQLTIAAGSADAAPGIAPLTATLLGDGGGAVEPHQFNDQIADLGGTLRIAVSAHRTSFRLQVPSSQFPAAIKAMAGLVQRPQLLGRNFESWRNWLVSRAYRDTLDDDNRTSLELFRRFVPGHAKEHRVSAYRAMRRELQAARLSHCKRFYARHYQAANSRVLVIGAVQAPPVAQLVEQQFTTFAKRSPSPAPVKPKPSGPRPEPASTIFVVDRPKTKKSSLHLALGNLPVSAESWPQIQVWRQFLLRHLRARLASRGHEQPIRSRLAPHTEGRAMLVIHTRCANDRVTTTIASLREAIATFGQALPKRQTTVFAQRQIAGRWADRLGSPEGIARLLSQYQELGLPKAYPSQYLSFLNRVTPARVRALKANVAAIAIFGDALALAPQLAKLGPVTALSPWRGFTLTKLPRPEKRNPAAPPKTTPPPVIND